MFYEISSHLNVVLKLVVTPVMINDGLARERGSRWVGGRVLFSGGNVLSSILG